ncbi:MAG: type I-B CRISPR-associated protein Cas5b [Nitrososphaerota archaeon]|nr:type I-B CRISPR-associated protein Cas5b [Candidatus Bathyarchaeota archaeon]MDW8024199.1 type I-B CRISPR-associated protein Cas5b [Nitrososphaerota archaeon]
MSIKLIVFDVKCFFAHFRKHFSTTSSLSYSFPPRTTIAGMMAAILGYDRNAYYPVFSSEKCRVALQVKTPVRRITNTVNYLMTDKPVTLSKLRGIGGQAQVHMEMLVSDSREMRQLSYRIFFNHEDDDLLKKVLERIKCRRFVYPPSLGTANNIAELEYVDFVNAEVYRPNVEVEAFTVIPVSVIKRILPQYDRRILVEELVPAEFAEDRELRREENYVYEWEGKPLKVVVDGEVFSCVLNGEKVAGVFM